MAFFPGAGAQPHGSRDHRRRLGSYATDGNRGSSMHSQDVLSLACRNDAKITAPLQCRKPLPDKGSHANVPSFSPTRIEEEPVLDYVLRYVLEYVLEYVFGCGFPKSFAVRAIRRSCLFKHFLRRRLGRLTCCLVGPIFLLAWSRACSTVPQSENVRSKAI